MRKGLYLVGQRSAAKGVFHFGIVDVGNVVENPSVAATVVYHQTPPQLRCNPYDRGAWGRVWGIHDQEGALKRLREALRWAEYNVLSNNCEHFAFYVATGQRVSPQVRGAVFWSGLTALALWAGAEEESPRRRQRRRGRTRARS